ADYQKRSALEKYEVFRAKDRPISVSDTKCNSEVMRAALTDVSLLYSRQQDKFLRETHGNFRARRRFHRRMSLFLQFCRTSSVLLF
uniref:Vps5 domain-containing protein n=1 Tax=Ascaris lumbricoides TaxID=6252 RepID=A0A0M3HK92_ASCLU